jgi:hypothetical protein
LISKMDEQLIHQVPRPIQQVHSASPHWQDRFYFNFMTRDGESAGLLGLGAFPNMGAMQGILNLVHRNKLYCTNFFRPLEQDREQIRFPNLQVDILEPMETWRLRLEEARYDIDLDLTFQGRGAPYPFRPIYWERSGEAVWDQYHYTQAGSYHGQILRGGEPITDLVGIRDRSWGIRDMRNLDFWIWISANFPSFWVTAWLAEDGAGNRICLDGALSRTDDPGQRRQIADMDYEIEFEPETRTPLGSRFRLKTDDGATVSLEAWARATIYVVLQEGVYSLDDPETRRELDASSMILDQAQRFSSGGEEGVGLTEYFVLGGCRRYPGNWPSMR